MRIEAPTRADGREHPGFLAGLLAAKLKEHPSGVAIQTLERSLTFSELDELSNGVCLLLHSEHRIRPGDRIVVLAEKAIAGAIPGSPPPSLWLRRFYL